MSAAWEIVLSLGSRRERSIRSIEIEVFQKFSNSLDFDTNSCLLYTSPAPLTVRRAGAGRR